MSQSKAQSLKETLSNTFIGTIGSFLITWVTLHFITNIVVASAVTTVLCTLWSISRGYAVRRYFNSKQEAK
ncbi:hypothetical protein CNR37_00048 [Pseudomonas phage ventosus]|uniref:Uncharacterized protein n=1 Tax=Pseudomonas phage ventosus TaxID=2048980 RepID=A0A2H4P7U8_9CAUD|nr:hypothetical protein CNR37_00048 [Pseudomonas phage ventosus]